MTKAIRPAPLKGARAIRFVLFAFVLLVLALAGCYLLLPIYSRALSKILLLQGAEACRAGNYNSAIAELDQAIYLDPKNADAYGYRGRAYFNKGDYDKA